MAGEKARAHFDIALRENPHYPDLYFYLGVVEHHAGNFAAAIDHLERAVALNPEYAEAMCLLGLAQHDAGFFDNAGRTFDRALALVRKTRNPLSRILVEKLDSRHFELPPIRELRAAMQDGDVYAALVRDATEAFNAGDYARAVSAFRDAVTMHPGYADLHARLGMSLLELGDPEASIPAFRRALDINPAYGEARYCLGIALFRAGECDRSAQELDRVAHSHPTYADVRAQAGLARPRWRFRFRTGEYFGGGHAGAPGQRAPTTSWGSRYAMGVQLRRTRFTPPSSFARPCSPPPPELGVRR